MTKFYRHASVASLVGLGVVSFVFGIEAVVLVSVYLPDEGALLEGLQDGTFEAFEAFELLFVEFVAEVHVVVKLGAVVVEEPEFAQAFGS
jgi:hypothetical protein